MPKIFRVDGYVQVNDDTDQAIGPEELTAQFMTHFNDEDFKVQVNTLEVTEVDDTPKKE